MIKEYDIQHENALISCILRDNSVYDDLEVQLEYFKQPKQREVISIISDIISKGGEANLVTVCDALRGKIDAHVVSGMMSNPSSANAAYYVEILKRNHEYCMIESLRYRLDEWLKCGDPSEILFELDKYITSITEGDKTKITDYRKIIHEAVTQIQKSYEEKKPLDGLSTGWRSVDNYLCGIPGGDLVIIGARPSIGKSTLMMNMAINMAQARIMIGIFTLEMRGINLAKRELAARMRKNYKDIRIGNLNRADFNRMLDAAGELSEYAIYIDDTPGLSITKLWQRARQMKRKGVGIIFVDYITLINHPNKKLPRFEQVSEIGKSLKQIARELDIPVVALSQLCRTAENKQPQLHEIRQSGDLEQDSDTIILLHRERDADETDFIIAKQRNGATGTVKMYFKREYLRFEEIINNA